MKQCVRCKIIKNESEFHKDKNRKDGLFSYCKPCKLRCEANRTLKLRAECFKLFGSVCKNCGETNTEVLSVNHIKSPKSKVYNGLRRGGWTLYKQLLDNPSLIKFFTLLCATCNQLDYYQRSGYYKRQLSSSAFYHRKKKERICEMWNNKCFHCFRTFPTELLTINHVAGQGMKERKQRKMRNMFQFPESELITRLDAGELEILCFSCNCSRSEYSKWTTQAKAQKEDLNNPKEPI